MQNNKKIIAVLPAYNAELTLRKTYDDIPKDWVDEIILVDDASRDKTVEVARTLPIIVIVHSKNLGYGGNQKTCYREALGRGADVVVMIHPDHQYDPKAIPGLIEPIVQGRADAVFGSRMIERGGARRGGMPYWKFVANIFLTKLENFVLGMHLTEYHSGFRAYSGRVLRTIALVQNSNDFVFDTEIIVQMKFANFRVMEIPIETRYFSAASMIGLRRSVRYGFAILLVLMRYVFQRVGLCQYSQFVIKKTHETY